MPNGKKIGNKFERDFSRMCSFWLCGDKNDLVIWRNADSGSIFTNRKKKGLDTRFKADFKVADPKYQSFLDLFYVDSKSYSNWNAIMIDSNNQKSNKLFQQWIKTVDECPKKMIPMMILNIRDRHTSDSVALPISTKVKNKSKITYSFDDKEKYNFNLYALEDFFKENQWEEFVKNNS